MNEKQKASYEHKQEKLHANYHKRIAKARLAQTKAIEQINKAEADYTKRSAELRNRHFAKKPHKT